MVSRSDILWVDQELQGGRGRKEGYERCGRNVDEKGEIKFCGSFDEGTCAIQTTRMRWRKHHHAR